MHDGKEKNVLPVSTAEYNPCGWRAWLNGTTLTLGMQNVFDSDPPFVAGAFENNYDESLATIRGRFWYVQLKKKLLAGFQLGEKLAGSSALLKGATAWRAAAFPRRVFGKRDRRAKGPRPDRVVKALA